MIIVYVRCFLILIKNIRARIEETARGQLMIYTRQFLISNIYPSHLSSLFIF